MLRIFRNIFKSKKKRKKRKSTHQQKLDRIELRQREYVENIFEEMTAKDPELKRLIIAKTFNITLPDASIGQRLEVEAVINDLVIQEIIQDPELAQKIVSGKIFQLMQNAGLAPSNEELRNRPTPMQQMIKALEDTKRLKEAAGIKEPGWLKKFLTSDLAAAIIPLLIRSFLKLESPDTQENQYIYVKDGEEREISRAEYERLMKEQQQQYNTIMSDDSTNENPNTKEGTNPETLESDETDDNKQETDALDN